MSPDEAVCILGVLLGAYLIGSIPASYLIAWYGFGVDLKRVGSGNVGATNAMRSIGPRAGIPAAFLDIAKGTIAVLTAGWILPSGGPLGSLGLGVACGVAAVLGHTYTLFLGFAGGKGVATGAGVFLALAPMPLLCCLVVFLVVTRFTRYVSLGSIVAALSLPGWILLFSPTDRTALVIISTGMALFIVHRHRANIARLRAGTEAKVSFGPSRNESSPTQNESYPPQSEAPR